VASEPGLDYARVDVEGFTEPTEVTVIDYCATNCQLSQKMRTLQDVKQFFESERPKWSKVRWISVDGLNWPVVKFLAGKYNLHRLAIEDLLSVQRTKIDLYSDRIVPPWQLFDFAQICMCVYSSMCSLEKMMILS
jgi:Mg2+ and Co2+ transporter CorA